MQRTLWAVVLAVFVVEYGVMYLLPRHYARLAFIPFRGRQALLPTRAVSVGYRGVENVAPTLAELGLDGFTYQDDEAIGAFEHGRGWLRMRYKFFGWNRTMGIVSIVPRMIGDTLHFEARALPAFALSMLPMVFILPDARLRFALAAVILVALALGVVMLRLRVNASLTLFLDAIERRARDTQRRNVR